MALGRVTAIVAAVVLLGSSAPRTWPSLRDAARLGLGLRGQPWEARRGIIFGPYYARVVALRRAIPAGEVVTIVPRRPADRDVAMFCVYAMYPTAARVAEDGVSRSRWTIVVDQSSPEVLTLRSAR